MYAWDSDDGGKSERVRRFNTVKLPALRVLGFALIVALLFLHQRFVDRTVSARQILLWTVAVGAYCLVSWRVLAFHYRRREPWDLGAVFLWIDLALFASAVYFSGADRSWLFILPLIRVADQTSTTFRRVIAFAHAAALFYAGVVVAGILFAGHAPSWPVELVKVGFLYAVGIYLALTARTAEGLRRQVRSAVEHSRQLIRKLADAERASEAANQAKSHFLANMSHEIRTPMGAIVGYADLLIDPALSASDRLDYVQTIRRNGAHLLSLINDILDLSKIEAGKMHVEQVACSPAELVVDVASLMRVRAVEKNLTFEVKYLTPIPERIQSDPMRIRQILMNLVGNAIKFTTTGRVDLLVRCEQADGPRRRISFEVADTGIGLTQVERARIFQPFVQADASTTRKFGGTGLGLVICERMATMLGGEITVESLVGRGSSFTLTIDTGALAGVPMLKDLAEAALPEPARSQESVGPAARLQGRVLLAEDGIDNQKLILACLRGAGLEAHVVDNGRSAVDEALAAHAAGRPFDVVLMDMQMPVLDGYGASSKLRSKDYPGTIIALTAHAMAGDREKCLAAGCDDYLTKPITRERLLAALAPRVKNATPGEAGPLVSELANDPVMGEILDEFVDGLGSRSEALAAAIAKPDHQTLARLAHQLKGAAGGYGFPTITEAAGVLEQAIHTTASAERIHALTVELATLCRRAAKGPTHGRAST